MLSEDQVGLVHIVQSRVHAAEEEVSRSVEALRYDVIPALNTLPHLSVDGEWSRGAAERLSASIGGLVRVLDNRLTPALSATDAWCTEALRADDRSTTADALAAVREQLDIAHHEVQRCCDEVADVDAANGHPVDSLLDESDKNESTYSNEEWNATIEAISQKFDDALSNLFDMSDHVKASVGHMSRINL